MSTFLCIFNFAPIRAVSTVLKRSSFFSRYGGGPSSEGQEDLDSEASVDDEDSTSDTLREDQENIFGDDQPNIRYKMR